MNPLYLNPPEHSSAPFVLEHRLENPQPTGDFTPSSVLWLTPRLRSSGLLQMLPGEELKTLLLVFTYLTPQGGFVATPELLASALETSKGKAVARLERLAGLEWQGEPILSHRDTEAGMRFFSPAQSLFEARRHLILPAPEPGKAIDAEWLQPPQRPLKLASRTEIMAHNRRAYTRPRAVVEAEIERFLQGDKFVEPENATPEVRQQITLLRRLTAQGLAVEIAERLIQTYPAERIERQLDWLPHRPARNPAAFLKSAIENDYEMPPALRFATSQAIVGETVQDVPPLQILADEVFLPDASEENTQQPTRESDGDSHE